MSTFDRVRRRFVYGDRDPVATWRPRASEPGRRSVMWANETYNELAERDQWAAIRRCLPDRRGNVLDLGCGTGRLALALSELFDTYVGVDLDSMVQEARRRVPALKEQFVASTVQDFDFGIDEYDLVLSMACLASACTAETLPDVAHRIVRATRSGGRVQLIDPFHTFPALARTCRLSPREVALIFSGAGLQLVNWSSLHFTPVRLAFAGNGRSPRLTRIAYSLGEAMRGLAHRALGDYKVLCFQRP